MKTFKQYIKENEESEENTEIHFPNGVYIAVTPDEATINAIKEYQKKYLKGQKVVEEDSLHCTLIYSQKPHVDEIESNSYQATATFNQFELFGPKSNILVIELISKELEARNNKLVQEHGFISDYNEYKPHITLAYDVEGLDLNSLPPIEFSMTLQDEYVEPLNTDLANDSDDESESGTLAGKALAKMKKEEE